MKIVVVGSLNMDLVVRMPKIPRPGETLLGGVFKTFPGGKGANQAVAAARLGAHVTMIGCVGDDAFGEEMRAALTAEGIDTTHVLVHPQTATGVALIQVDAQGQNSIAVASGANFCLTGADVEKAMQTIGEFEALVMPLETPLETIYAAARIASRQGAKVLLNPAPAQVLEKDLLELVDVLLPNEYEVTLMTGVQSQSPADIRCAAEKLLSLGTKNLIVTLGGQGSALFNASGQETLIPACPAQAVDTTAAGDCFVGALAVALCERKSLPAAAEFASAAAAISVTRAGAQPSLPYRNEVEQFMYERNKPL
ncbi:MAG: ribokinase [Chloroflexi bacterium]|nr:MAG: ribokinase [Chloroflexota bacterium]